MRLRILIICCLLYGFSSSAPRLVAQESTRTAASLATTQVTFSTDDGLVFDAEVVSPAERERNGYGVLMIGGGVGNDLHWSTPGAIGEGQERRPLTLTGQTHADAPAIARSLAQRGFTVMHWSTLHQQDPKRRLWPSQATPHSPRELLRFSAAALAAFRERNRFPPRHVLLLGHSLGAVRAANLAADDNGICALILLAPAQFTRTGPDDAGRNQNRRESAEFLKLADQNQDRRCSEAEFSTWLKQQPGSQHPLARQSFERLDFHSDGLLVDWEISAGIARHRRAGRILQKPAATDAFGMRWTEDILSRKPIPTLVIYGTLDNAQSHHAPVIADLIESQRLRQIDLKIIPDVGHQLGPEDGGQVGPISLAVCDILADWARSRVKRQPD
ncbi:MAG: alpha/beta hydrolase [Pirellulaceae bacterium]|nr:alpha/beta hydrolase [Pirellulaceae bacterium]